MSIGKPIFVSALLLTVVNLLLRFASTGFQVFLSARIGAEGIGLLQLVLSVSTMATVAAMAGVRTATMYLTAEEIGKNRFKNIRNILSSCIGYSIGCSLLVSSVVFVFAPYLAKNWIRNVQTVDSIRLFAAFLPVNCLTGVMVGYFTGAQKIFTLAAVEVVEQLCSMVCTVLLLNAWAGHDPARCSFAVVLGSGIAGSMTLTTLMVLRLLERAPKYPRVNSTGRLLDIAIPLAIADDLRTGISTLENLIVPRRLALFAGEIAPLATFGTVCGMVFPVLMFPIAILYGMTELLVPELARCKAAGSQRRIKYLVRRGLRIALLYGALCAGVLYLSADALCMALYHNKQAAQYLKLFAPLAVMLYMDAVTDSMVKGLGQQKASVRYNILTNCMDVVLLYKLLPVYGMNGYYFSFLMTHVINFLLSIRRLLRISGVQIDWKVPAATLISAITAGVLAQCTDQGLIRAVTYCALFPTGLFLTKVLTSEDLNWIIGLIKPNFASKKNTAP